MLAEVGSWEPWEISDLKTQERQKLKSEAVPHREVDSGEVVDAKKRCLENGKKKTRTGLGGMGGPGIHCTTCCKEMRIYTEPVHQLPRSKNCFSRSCGHRLVEKQVQRLDMRYKS